MITLSDEVKDLLKAGKILIDPKPGSSFEGQFVTYAKDKSGCYYAVIDDGQSIRILQTPDRDLIKNQRVCATANYLPNSYGGISKIRWWGIKQLSPDKLQLSSSTKEKDQAHSKSISQLSNELNKRVEIGNPLRSESKNGRFCGYIALATGGYMGVVETKDSLFTFRCSNLSIKAGEQVEIRADRQKGLEYRFVEKCIGMER